MSGFRQTLGTIVAIVLVIVLTVGGIAAVRWYQRQNQALGDARQVVADSMIAVLRRGQAELDRRRTAERDSLRRAIAAAEASARAAEGRAGDVRAALAAQRARADSLQAAADSARTIGDTATAAAKGAAAAAAGSISLDSAMALVIRQHAADSTATADQASATARCVDTMRSCELGRIRADSLAAQWQEKYELERAKERPRWQRWSIEIGKAVAIAWVTRAIVK